MLCPLVIAFRARALPAPPLLRHCSFGDCCEVFSERKLCGFVRKIEYPQIIENLRVDKIELSDVTCNENEIDLLIRADLIGKLLTGRCIQLHFGLATIHTKLGWTVIGKETGLYSSDDYKNYGFCADRPLFAC
ncbi:hypothetical protein AVEN_83599-1 [Araneus ventricosus]|uniref:Peptidase aspartic putative domain-containing protein n=1 Tax=Araneus ventricosus TaxID=182803 RepID=A0A4Y2WSD4_ARAVE|nr:hypothetical protein AVEN_83599-1 [Araneus ventricosus]